MKIEVDKDLMQIRIYDGVTTVSIFNFDMCDEDDLNRNEGEFKDLLNHLKVKIEY